ncbi:MAG TPA: MFS transporter [Gaiellaceae bacterium]|nr:MFS transporter [Gaiellaceae bacterium]
MRALRRLYLLVWGPDVVPALRPLLAVSLAGSLAGSAGWSFLGIWAVKRLGASSLELGLAFLAGAVLSAGVGYFGGHLSDYLGRRPVILFGWGGQATFGLLFLTVGTQTTYGLALLAVIPAFGALGSAADQALVADLVQAERREASYAATRVASNLGTTLGPPIGGLLLLLGSWTALFLGVFALSVAAFAVALRWLPRRGDFAPESPPERGSFGVIRHDRIFLLFLVSGTLAFIVYVAFAVVLPISLVASHGFSASTWGFLVVVNPLLVTLFQLRLTRRVTAISPATKLFVAMLLMGLPFLLLSVNASIFVVVLILLVFVLGEMLWVPTSQTVVAAIAPEDLRGAYMGAFGATAAAGFALGPLLGLQVRHAFGDSAMWIFFAAVSVAAAFTGAAAARRVKTSEGPAEAGPSS